MDPVNYLLSELNVDVRASRVAISVVCFVFLALGSCSRAYGDVGVILNDSLDTSVARITGSGHSAVYLSRICPESPVKLRLCRDDEDGSVMSNYTSLGEDEPFEWNIVPLSVYLYGVENPENRPIFGSQKIKTALEERYLENYLSAYCTDVRCRTSDKAEWREMVGAALSRSLYIFVADTSVEQDRELIAKFNSLPNKNHFNPVTRNCADFTRAIVDTYFPHATHPDYINDFGMTSPKAIARSFTRYAQRHPEAHFRVLHIAQVPGTIKQSSEPRTGTEQLFRSKKLLVPMVLLGLHELPIVMASYELTGRFNPESAFEEHPSAAPTGLQLRTAQDQAEAPTDIVGTSAEWKADRKAFQAVLQEAVQEEIIPAHANFKDFFKRIDAAGTPSFDPDGGLWMEISDAGKASSVGISVSNVVAPGSDAETASGLLLARIATVLKNSKHRRETLPEFEEDWDILQRARTNTRLTDAHLSDPWSTKSRDSSPERLFSWVTHRLS